MDRGCGSSGVSVPIGAVLPLETRSRTVRVVQVHVSLQPRESCNNVCEDRNSCALGVLIGTHMCFLAFYRTWVTSLRNIHKGKDAGS